MASVVDAKYELAMSATNARIAERRLHMSLSFLGCARKVSRARSEENDTKSNIFCALFFDDERFYAFFSNMKMSSLSLSFSLSLKLCKRLRTTLSVIRVLNEAIVVRTGATPRAVPSDSTALSPRFCA